MKVGNVIKEGDRKLKVIFVSDSSEESRKENEKRFFRGKGGYKPKELG